MKTLQLLILIQGLVSFSEGQGLGTLPVEDPSFGYNGKNASLQCYLNTSVGFSRVAWKIGTTLVATYNVFTNTFSPRGNFINRSWYDHNTSKLHCSMLNFITVDSDYERYTCEVDTLVLSTGYITLLNTSKPEVKITTDPPHDNGSITQVLHGNVTLNATSSCSLPGAKLKWESRTDVHIVEADEISNCTGNIYSGTSFISGTVKITNPLNASLSIQHPYYDFFPEEYPTRLLFRVQVYDACKSNPCKNGASCTSNVDKPDCSCVMDFNGPICAVCLSGGQIAGCVVGYLAGGVLIVCLIVFAVKSQSFSGGQLAGIVIGCLAGMALFIALTVFGANRKCLSGGEIAGFVIGCLAGCVPSVCLILFAVKKWTGTAKGDKNHAGGTAM